MEQDGDEGIRAGEGEVVAVDGVHGRAGKGSGQLELSPGRDESVLAGHHDGCRDFEGGGGLASRAVSRCCHGRVDLVQQLDRAERLLEESQAGRVARPFADRDDRDVPYDRLWSWSPTRNARGLPPH